MPATTDILPESAAAPAATATAAAAPATKSSRGFRQSGLLAESTLRKLRARQQQFGQTLAAKLGNFLRLDCQVEVASLQTVSFEGLIGRLLTPTHLVLFKLESLRGICLLEMPPSLALPIVDRLLGGAGKPNEKDSVRPLTEIETALLDQVTEILLAEWCQSWRDVRPLHHTLLGHEIDGHFLRTVAREAMMLDIVLQITAGECKQNCRLGLPYHGLEPLIQQMNAAAATPAAETVSHTPKPPVWNPVLDDAPIRIQTRCHGLKFTTGGLAHLKIGDTLPLEPQHLTRVQLHLGEHAKFVGALGKVGTRWAVRITHKQEGKTS